MNMRLFRRERPGAEESPNAPPSAPSSPFLQAKQEWFERNGDLIQQAAQWRTASLFAFGLLGISLCGNVAQGLQNKVVPYIVQVDSLGNAAAVRRADAASTAIPDRVIQAEIANVITNWRTVTADLALQQQMLSKLNAFVSGSAKGVVKEWLTANNPYDRAKSSLVSVNIKGVPLPVSPNSWRVEWVETTRNHAGLTQETIAFEATLTITIIPPTTDAQVVANPGGVVVTDLAFGKLLGQR
jgi:type IV secretion system protein VirB5